MRPMPSSAMLIRSGSARDRTPMPRSARLWTRSRTRQLLLIGAAAYARCGLVTRVQPARRGPSLGRPGEYPRRDVPGAPRHQR
jgi:hypothetical protein